LAKKSLDGQKAQPKKDLDGQKAHTTTHVQVKKDDIKAVQTAKQPPKKDLDKQKKTYNALLKVNESNKVKIFDLNCMQSSLMRMRMELQNVKALNKEVKALTKKLHAQLEEKLGHELSMQKMKNEYKQLGLAQACKKFENKKVPMNKTLTVALTLEHKKSKNCTKLTIKGVQKMTIQHVTR
jgi:hypothetical protein